MKAFIAGPMRRIVGFNFPAFAEAEGHLYRVGIESFSPARQDIEDGFEWWRYDGTEDLAQIGFDLRAATARNMNWLTEQADAIYLLNGWAESSGAVAELAVANMCGLETLYQPTTQTPERRNK